MRSLRRFRHARKRRGNVAAPLLWEALDGRPEFDAVMAWVTRFEADPFDPELDGLVVPPEWYPDGISSDIHPRIVEYQIPGAEHLSVMVGLEGIVGADGVLTAFLVFPLSPGDLPPPP